ncbi:hypothetical protein [Alkalibacillus aidingensis]|uniref:hypothetical protein n=1 Tax=Alkalibacillus aidingensis TaxID=2747607 RepID=UPI001661637D|nr:hypothetical protein [Alkalibacillus aidingensis]
MEMNSNFISTKDLCDLLSIDRFKLRQMVKKNQFPEPITKYGNMNVWDKNDVVDYFNNEIEALKEEMFYFNYLIQEVENV